MITSVYQNWQSQNEVYGSFRYNYYFNEKLFFLHKNIRSRMWNDISLLEIIVAFFSTTFKKKIIFIRILCNEK